MKLWRILHQCGEGGSTGTFGEIMRICKQDADGGSDFVIRNRCDPVGAVLQDIKRCLYRLPAGHAIGEGGCGLRGHDISRLDGKPVGRGVFRDDRHDLGFKPQKVAHRDQSAGAGTHANGDIDHVEIVMRPEKFQRVGRNAKDNVPVKARHHQETAFTGQPLGSAPGNVEVATVDHEISTKGLHRPVLALRISFRHHDGGGQAKRSGGQCHGLAVVSAGGRNDAAGAAVFFDMFLDVDDGAARLEGSDRRVVLVFDRDFQTEPLLQQWPGITWGFRHKLAHDRKSGFKVVQGEESSHGRGQVRFLVLVGREYIRVARTVFQDPEPIRTCAAPVPASGLRAMQTDTVHTQPGSVPIHREMAGYGLRLLPAAGYDVGFVAETGSIGFAFDCQSGSHAIASDRREDFVRLPNTLALTPSGCDIRSRSEMGGEYLLVSGREIRLTEGGYRTNILSKSASMAAGRLRKWMLSDTPPDHLETEACINALAEAGLKPQRPGKAARWMTGNRFRKVADRIEADLGSNLSVAVLAQEIGVSASFLSRAFSAYCGQSPYDYIVSRRLQRARALIVSTGKPLSEIALRSGFSSQSHMTASFRTRLGVSPSKFARPDR